MKMISSASDTRNSLPTPPCSGRVAVCCGSISEPTYAHCWLTCADQRLCPSLIICSGVEAGPSAFSVYALRLGPGEDIVTSLLKFVEDKKLKAPFVMTCVGSITKATLRLANATASNTNQIIHLNERFEIVSLVGTLNKAPHLHICLSDKDGKTVGGHVISDLEVFTTAEIVIGECTGLQFTREMDDRTGFPELVISSRSEKA
ncbi:uncharacterized protein LOC112120809 [Terrapene carolina triunguis]|uniref:uncharacterized protein LOC112120809 n=1 Tax=Terrapene triunguis TaxID=2587831 RepID=UPI000CEFE280|nr:uncharacterized protein LOC112120809 [Terrapene carolina triunguis]